MLRLSLPSQYNSNAAPSTCRAGRLCTLIEGVGAPLRDNWIVHRRRVRRLSIECTVETKLGQTSGRVRRPGSVSCSRVEASPWRAGNGGEIRPSGREIRGSGRVQDRGDAAERRLQCSSGVAECACGVVQIGNVARRSGGVAVHGSGAWIGEADDGRRSRASGLGGRAQ